MSSMINHQVGIAASPREIFEHLTVPEKLALWWTTDTRGDGAHVGDTIEFWFKDFCQKFRVEELETGKRVAWKAPTGQGSNEWEGTEVTFDLTPNGKQTFVQFHHSGWREATNFQGHCSTRWAIFLLSLKDVLERGKGRPFPYDLEAHHR